MQILATLRELFPGAVARQTKYAELLSVLSSERALAQEAATKSDRQFRR